nr:probable serine/threonine-protein kinase DDB_G0272254 [Penaeus vannamei]
MARVPQARRQFAAKDRQQARLCAEQRPRAPPKTALGVWGKAAPTPAARRVQDARAHAANCNRSTVVLKRRGFPMMAPGQVDLLKKRGKKLGEGHFSTAVVTRWHGADAVLKAPRQKPNVGQFVKECGLLHTLEGAGGAPEPLGLCLYPLAQVISFAGPQTLGGYLEESRSSAELLRLAADLCGKVSEVHEKGIIHNDLKFDNVIVDGRGQIHLIDFGNANPQGQTFCLVSKGQRCPWLGPEVFSQHLSSPAQDAFSVGFMLDTISKLMP